MSGGEHTELRPLFLLSDEPIASHEEDFLSRGDEARALAGVVLGTTGPFSIGIYGQWGSGKTSLLHHVKSLLDARDPKNAKHLAYPYLVTVTFNAWQHEKDDQPLAHLAEAVDAAITKRLQEVRSITGAVEEKAVEWLRSAHMAARSLIYASSLESGIDAATAMKPETGFSIWKLIPFLKFNPANAIDRYEKLRQESTNPDSRLWKEHVRQSVSRSVLRTFRADSKLLEQAKPGNEGRLPRIVVFIDDMDRCVAEDAFNLLQAIKLVIAQPGYIFVMTLDPAALHRVIVDKTSEVGENVASASKAIYLDKLVQVPFPLRLHDEQFSEYVDKIISVRLKNMLVKPENHRLVETDKTIEPLWQAFRDLQPVLAVSSEKNPRTLVRRINSLMMDTRLAPRSIKERFQQHGAAAEAVFIGLCLIRHTLRHFVGVSETTQLSSSQALCTLIKTRGLTNCIDRLQAILSGRLSEFRVSPVPAGESPGNEPDDAELLQKRELLQVLKFWPRLDELFRTEAGQRWLSAKEDRDLVDTFYAKRPGQSASAQQVRSTSRETRADGSDRSSSVQLNESGPQASSKPSTTTSTISATEFNYIKRAICGELDLPVTTEITPDHLARVTKLNLDSVPITDDAAAWLAHPDTGLKSLDLLKLGHTNITDVGVQKLAAENTGLRSLTSLVLYDTMVSDDGVRALASERTGLNRLVALWLGWTRLTDVGVQLLARRESGLKSLLLLDLGGTQITDSALEDLSMPNSGLTPLKSLILSHTRITDRGVQYLCREDSGLRSLDVIDVDGTDISELGEQSLRRRFRVVRFIR